MRARARVNPVLVVLALLVPALAWASSVSTSLRVAGLPGRVFLSATGTSAAVAPDTAGNATKRAAVVAAVVSGQAVKVLVRVQQAPNGTFVDLVFSDTLGNLTTAVGAMDLSTAVVGHPAPGDDAVDASAIVAGG